MKVRDIAKVYKFNSVFDEIRVSTRTDNYTITANNIDAMMGKDFMDEEVELVETAGGSLLVTTEIVWEKSKPESFDHNMTAVTVYRTEGFKIWKGKYRVFSCIYSANEWHLERLADNRVVYSASTAKECMKYFHKSKNRWMD